MNKFRITLLALGAGLVGSAWAADPPSPADSLPKVEVTAVRQDLAEKSYRKLLKAMDMFQAWHADHPGTSMRFRIFARRAGVDLHDLAVDIIDRETGGRTRVDVAPDGSFTVPVIASARDDDAVVRASFPDDQLAWRVIVRHDADDPAQVRLGDALEACRIDVDAADLARKVWTPAALLIRKSGVDLCTFHSAVVDGFAERPVFAVHLHSGTRHGAVMSDRLHLGSLPAAMAELVDATDVLRDREYAVPDGEDHWPDDTVLEFSYADADPGQALARSGPASAPRAQEETTR